MFLVIFGCSTLLNTEVVYAQFVVGTETIVKSFNVTVTGAL